MAVDKQGNDENAEGGNDEDEEGNEDEQQKMEEGRTHRHRVWYEIIHLQLLYCDAIVVN